MENKVVLMAIAFLLFGFGCSINDTSGEEPDSYSINYETNEVRGQIDNYPDFDYSKYKQSQRRMSEFKETDAQHLDADIYTNEETDRVTEHLKKQDNILNAQVATTNDRIIVAVNLSDYGDRDVGNEIEQEVRTIVPSKEIVVYTDYTYSEHVKDKKASEGASEIGENLEQFLESFFNVDFKN